MDRVDGGLRRIRGALFLLWHFGRLCELHPEEASPRLEDRCWLPQEARVWRLGYGSASVDGYDDL